MNGYQIIVLLFAFIVAGVSVWAVLAVTRSPGMRYKPFWIIGSLFGFVGFGIDWANPNDLLLEFGVMVPVVGYHGWFPAGPVIVKAGFPIIAALALLKVYDRPGDAV